MNPWEFLSWAPGPVGPIMIPLVAALLAFLMGRRTPLPWLLLITATGIILALVGLTGQVREAGVLRYAIGGWGAPLGIDLYVDGLSLLMLWMTAGVGALVSLYALSYFRHHPHQAGYFWPLWLLLWTALNALFLAADIFNLYVTLELLTLAAVSLATLAGGAAALKAGMRYLLFALLGSFSYLLGVALLYGGFGTLDMSQLAQVVMAGPLVWTAIALLTVGLLTKSAIFPLHVWLPPAHANAPAPVSALLSALVVKASFYLLLRLWFSVFSTAITPTAGQLLGALGAGAILYGSFQALRQTRLKLLVAYSTVAQLGYLLLVFPMAGTLAWRGIMVHALSHAFAKAALFLAAGNILRTLRHDRIRNFHDLERGLPLTLFAFGLAGVSLMGLPPSGGFLAKWLLLEAALDTGQWWWVVVILAGGLLAAGYIFRVLKYDFSQGKTSPMARTEANLSYSMELTPLVLALLSIALGFAGVPVLILLDIGPPVSASVQALDWQSAMPLLVLFTSLGAGIVIFLLGEESHRLRTGVNLTAAIAKLILVSIMLWGVYQEQSYEFRLPLLPGLDLLLRTDAFAMFFMTLSAALWLVTTLYAVGYLEGSPHRSRFFGFFSLCVASTVGVAMAGNLFTFFIFYELLTLSTYPLVVHRGTPESLRAGDTYLRYTLGGGVVLLLGIIWLYTLTGTQSFTEGGALGHVGEEHDWTLRFIFLLLIAGFGVKASLIPLHGWLPRAMVAPAPVSALLHAVAVVKAGAFGIVRVVYDIYGVTFAHALNLTQLLAWLAAATIIYGSLRALSQDDLKRRLAYSTISQVAYIVLGVAIAGPMATIGGIVHLVHQGLMKITLFFCAGNLAETLGIHKISEMDGVGRRMPWTMVAFTLGALGMTGMPPTAGFISKWYLGLGGLEVGQSWVVVVLVVSTFLNAAYFLPILYRAWFRPEPAAWPHEDPRGRFETRLVLLTPPLITAALALGAGLLAGAPFSPLEWAGLIAEREYLYASPASP